ncbi:MAG: hypothetical protein CMQ29_02965 [Gammaproteobacteria bacterium]|nr:hypothetical protein [Gammaproteobacteria bacterium]
MPNTEGALAGVKILDLTDERAIYGAKLMADMGADVVRPEPPEGDPLRARGPHRAADDGMTSLWHRYFASNRRAFKVDPATEAGLAQLQQLATAADIVLTCMPGFATDALDVDAALAANPGLVCVETSSFGADGPWRDFQAPDLVAGALGGSVSTTGDVDTPPLKTFGELNFAVSGAYVAIAALAALHHARTTGEGQKVQVPVHECITSCLEHVLMWRWYEHTRPMRPGKSLARRGSLHWSNAYVVMQAEGGSIMVTPTPDVDAQLAWMIEEDAHDDLIDPKYMEIENRPAFVKRMMELLHQWVGTREVEALMHDAQSRHCPYGWVLPIEQVADNPQLKARDWWTAYPDGVKGPGAPYHFSSTPWSMGDYEPAKDPDALLAELNWQARS